MARRTTIIYSCDSCSKTVDNARDLTRVHVEIGRGRHIRFGNADLCDICLSTFVAQLEVNNMIDREEEGS